MRSYVSEKEMLAVVLDRRIITGSDGKRRAFSLRCDVGRRMYAIYDEEGEKVIASSKRKDLDDLHQFAEMALPWIY